MKYLLNIQKVLLEDDSKVVSYSLIIALWFILIIFSILVLRLDKLKIVLKFIILFFKKSNSDKDLNNF
jgi:hypothetical protein